MSPLFILSKNEFFEDNPEARVVPEFDQVGGVVMKFICLIYGYRSPIKQMPVEPRRKKAISLCGIERTPTGRPSKLEKDLLELRDPKIKAAISVFKEIQFDEDVDTIEAYDEQIAEFRDFLRKKNKDKMELEKAGKIGTTLLPQMLEARDLMEKRISSRVDQLSQEDFEEQTIEEEIPAIEKFLQSRDTE